MPYPTLVPVTMSGETERIGSSSSQVPQTMAGGNRMTTVPPPPPPPGAAAASSSSTGTRSKKKLRKSSSSTIESGDWEEQEATAAPKEAVDGKLGWSKFTRNLFGKLEGND